MQGSSKSGELLNEFKAKLANIQIVDFIVATPSLCGVRYTEDVYGSGRDHEAYTKHMCSYGCSNSSILRGRSA